MITFDQDALHDAIIDRASAQLLENLGGGREMLRDAVDKRVAKIFAETAEREISERVQEAINVALDREYFAVDNFGQKRGEATTIAKQLDRIVGAYWSERVSKNGAVATSSYDTMTRAEYIMAQVCANDFTEQMKQAAVSVTAALKDGFRAQMAGHVDKLLDELFRVKSLQDQGKASKPY